MGLDVRWTPSSGSPASFVPRHVRTGDGSLNRPRIPGVTTGDCFEGSRKHETCGRAQFLDSLYLLFEAIKLARILGWIDRRLSFG